MSRVRRRGLTCGLLGVGFAMVLLPSLAPATVEEQRARLPPPAVCADPLEGVWVSHKYESPYDEWMIFTLDLRRDPRGAASPTVLGVVGRTPIVGRITARAWFGSGPQGSAPPAWAPGIHPWEVGMSAEGFADGGRIELWGTRWAVQNVWCGPRSFGYNLDHFTGVIDPSIQEFQSVNNDGGRAVNDPTVFRRVRCYEPTVVQHPVVAPPAFRPSPRSGCAR